MLILVKLLKILKNLWGDGMIKLELVDNIQYVIMNNGENRQNPEFAHKILKALNEIKENPQIQSVVLSSSDEKNWSQGIDLLWIKSAFEKNDFTAVKEFLYKMGDVFKTLLMYPIPVIAEITGHAFGNGALLACACDFRFMRSDKGFFCFPEVDVNIPFLPSMISFAEKAVPFQKFQELVFSGKRITATEAFDSGILNGVFEDLNQLKNGVYNFAINMKKGRNIYGELKKRIYKDVMPSFDEDRKIIENLMLFYP